MKAFRKVALDRLASPEQLDRLMQVTDPRGWLILCSFGIVLTTAAVWGVLGRIQHDVPATGMLVRSGGVFEINALSTGRITDLAVRVGDTVAEGQVVGRMYQQELNDKLRDAKATLAELEEQHAEIVAHGSKELALQTSLLERRRATLGQSIVAARRSARSYRQTVRLQRKLVADGLLTRQTVLGTRHQLDQARQQVGDGKSELAQIAVEEQELRARREEEIRASQTRIAAQKRVVAGFERDMKSTSEVVSHHTGRILEIVADQGAIVAKGDTVLTLDLTGRTVKELEAVLYVPSTHGKQVAVGMPVYIAPSTVKQEEYGLMVGRVTYVSDYPATSRGILRVLKNDKLLEALVGGDAPYEVHADLVIDEHTISRYRWSSSEGPPLRIQSGTRAAAYITVGTRRPIEMVVPLLRRHTGL